MDDSALGDALFSPSKAAQQRAQAQDWQHVEAWLSSLYPGRALPTFERNEETLKALLELAAANERADEEAAAVMALEEEARHEMSEVRATATDSVAYQVGRLTALLGQGRCRDSRRRSGQTITAYHRRDPHKRRQAEPRRPGTALHNPQCAIDRPRNASPRTLKYYHPHSYPNHAYNRPVPSPQPPHHRPPQPPRDPPHHNHPAGLRSAPTIPLPPNRRLHPPNQGSPPQAPGICRSPRRTTAPRHRRLRPSTLPALAQETHAHAYPFHSPAPHQSLRSPRRRGPLPSNQRRGRAVVVRGAG